MGKHEREMLTDARGSVNRRSHKEEEKVAKKGRDKRRKTERDLLTIFGGVKKICEQ